MTVFHPHDSLTCGTKSTVVYITFFVHNRKGGENMSKSRGVSGNTHSRQQLNDYSNQNNRNNHANRANNNNRSNQSNPNNSNYKGNK